MNPIHNIINARAKMHQIETFNKASRYGFNSATLKSMYSKANQGIFINRLIYNL